MTYERRNNPIDEQMQRYDQHYLVTFIKLIDVAKRLTATDPRSSDRQIPYFSRKRRLDVMTGSASKGVPRRPLCDDEINPQFSDGHPRERSFRNEMPAGERQRE